MIPNKQKCEELLEKYSVPENIRNHLRQVRKIGSHIARKSKIEVNIELTEATCHLHDIAKEICAKEKCSHYEMALEILTKEGCKEIGKVAFPHGLHSILENELDSLEKKIVYYADKRVKHDKIVSLKERFDDLLKRYVKHKDEIKKAIPLVYELEKELSELIGEDLKNCKFE